MDDNDNAAKIAAVIAIGVACWVTESAWPLLALMLLF